MGLNDVPSGPGPDDEAEPAVRRLLSRACGDEQAPPGLRERILERIDRVSPPGGAVRPR
ncbi:hypothetical protein ABT095_13815 [Kitasatospora sp. NPDC002227]|uniref:hypothetical protein n=1 Tax=Kitasatospora sp. NPDC002227 TaxID=3154773 RepID=UPI003324224E